MALGGGFSQGNAINDVGQVTGTSNGHAFLYSNGQMTDLGTLGGDSSFGNSINNVGQVTGSSTTSLSDFVHAFLYSSGQMRDLNDLIDPTLGVTLTDARTINNHGQIVANDSMNSGRSSGAYLLTPIPGPSTLALFGVALLGLGVWARTRKS
jgi:probable HAF family extracellular repeat protein